MRQVTRFAVLASAALLTAALAASAQDRGSRPPEVVSPEVSAERKVSFRIYAPKATAVKLSSSDIPNTGTGDFPGGGQGVTMKKADNGVWEATVGPVAAGSYRHNFNVDGLAVIDPR